MEKSMGHRPKIEYEMCKIGDIEVNYARKGIGQPVVFVHGLAEDHESWVDVLKLLPEDIAVYAYDFRGHGKTSLGKAAATAEQLGDDLIKFSQLLGKPVIAVGFSLGGVIVTEAALKSPELFKRIILVGTSSKVGKAAAKFFEERIEQVNSNLEQFYLDLVKDTEFQIAHLKHKVRDVAEKRIKAVGNGAGYVNAATAMLKVANNPLTEKMRNLKTQVTIVQGKEDIFCPIKASEIMLEVLPMAKYIEIDNAGHLMTTDQPEKLAKIIIQEVNS